MIEQSSEHREPLLLQPGDSRYAITRTSLGPYYNEENKPCDEAFLARRVIVDAQEWSETESDWYSKGTNHRVKNRFRMRDMGESNCWAVEIPDIREFCKKYGRCLINLAADGIFEIERQR